MLATTRQPPRLLRDVGKKRKSRTTSLLSRVHCVRKGQRVPNLDCNVTVFGLYERAPKGSKKTADPGEARADAKKAGCELAPLHCQRRVRDRETGLCVAIPGQRCVVQNMPSPTLKCSKSPDRVAKKRREGTTTPAAGGTPSRLGHPPQTTNT